MKLVELRHLLLTGLAAVALSGSMGGPGMQDSPPDVIVYASDLPRTGLSEFDFWEDPASPEGMLVGTHNNGDHLDPPPEDDPHVRFTVLVRSGVAYRCWIHMKVGPPKGEALANRLWVQVSDAIDQANREMLKPGTGSYLTAQGPTTQGWTWVPCDPDDPGTDRLVRFRVSGQVSVRLQAGMEGVGFDQFLLSPSRFLEKPPSEAVVAKHATPNNGALP